MNCDKIEIKTKCLTFIKLFQKIVSFQYGLWTDSRERLHWDPTSQDIGEIIANCASTHWADRKDGLMGLQMYFR